MIRISVFKKIIRKSCHGTEYSIPENMRGLFAELDEAVENADYGSDEEGQALDSFLDVFETYERIYAPI